MWEVAWKSIKCSVRANLHFSAPRLGEKPCPLNPWCWFPIKMRCVTKKRRVPVQVMTEALIVTINLSRYRTISYYKCYLSPFNTRAKRAKSMFDSFHGVRKSQKKSHSTLRAKRATFKFWVDKSSLKNAKNDPIWRVFENLKLKHTVTRQVSLK